MYTCNVKLLDNNSERRLTSFVEVSTANTLLTTWTIIFS